MTTQLYDPWSHATTTPETSVPPIGNVTPTSQSPAPAKTDPQPANSDKRVRSTNVSYGVPEITPSISISGLRGNYMLLVPQDQCQEYPSGSKQYPDSTKIKAVALILNSNPTFYTEDAVTREGVYQPLEWEGKAVQPGDVLPLSVFNSSIKKLLKENYNQIYLPKGSSKKILRGKVAVTRTKDNHRAVIFVSVENPPPDVIANITNPEIVAKIRAFEDQYADFLFEPA